MRSVWLICAASLFVQASAKYRAFTDYMIYGSNVQGFCKECPEVIELFKRDPRKALLDAKEACKSTEYFTPRICEEEYRIYADAIIQIVKEITAPTDQVCKYLAKGACGQPEEKIYKWAIDLSKYKDDSQFPAPKSTYPVQKFLHITDTHFDEDYEVGADANCNEPLCCTKYINQTTNLEYFSGPWGHPLGMACDIPIRTVVNMFEDIKARRKVDYVIWTGDISSHSYLGMTKERAVADIKETTKLFKKYLPGKTVYPAIGNHDAYPDRLFPQPDVNAAEFSVKPLYEEMWNLWKDWLPANQEKTFKYGGYYTAVVHRGLRIIALNTNFCYTANWWLVLGANDPADQLKWFAETLEKARKNKERVHIIGHIPPGTPTCYQYWENMYFDLVAKYRNTIAGQFFAHMHNDEVILDYSHPNANKSNEVTAVIYASPAVTTSWSGMPTYRIFKTKNHEVFDHENYILNLTTANANYMRLGMSTHKKLHNLQKAGKISEKQLESLYGKPKWQLGYSASDSYGTKDFSNKGWSKLFERLRSDDAFFQKFYKHHVQFRPNIAAQSRPCDTKCQTTLLKYMVSQKTHRGGKVDWVNALSGLKQEVTEDHSGHSHKLQGARPFIL